MEVLDTWSSEEFEDNVASALISVYESKVRRNKGSGPFAIKEKHLSLYRKTGAYIPSNSRMFIMNDVDENNGFFDTENDDLPRHGCIGLEGQEFRGESQYNGYFTALHFSRSKIPKHIIKIGSGTVFELKIIAAENDGIRGERRFFSVSKKGDVVACDQQAHIYNSYGGARTHKSSDVEPHILNETSALASYALQSQADRRFCWSIQAQEKAAKVTLGCMKEEIKSLLYARSLPMTATGRKRPVLHLVESHKRRIKSGIDINITPFLRGVQEIEMGGTLFKVNPPKIEKPNLSENSKRYYL